MGWGGRGGDEREGMGGEGWEGGEGMGGEGKGTVACTPSLRFKGSLQYILLTTYCQTSVADPACDLLVVADEN